MIWHYIICQMAVDYYSPAATIKVFFALTWSGVDLFFVLSGFLIGGILLDNKDAANYFQVFYIRRACRIFPLYYAWLVSFLTISSIVPFMDSWQFFGADNPLAAYFTYTQNFFMSAKGNLEPRWTGITWSLAVEEQFYVLFPMLIFLIPRRRLPLTLLLLVALAPVWRVFLFNNSNPPGFYSMLMVPCRMDALMLGTLAAYIYRKEALLDIVRKNREWIYLILLLLAGVLINLTFKVRLYSFALSNLIAFDTCYYGYSVLAIFYFLILLVALTEKRGPITACARNKYLQHLGIISYGVYIFHQTVSDFIHALFLRQAPILRNGWDVLATGAAFIITIALAQLSWNLFEKRIVAWGHQFKYRHEKKGSGETPVSVVGDA